MKNRMDPTHDSAESGGYRDVAVGALHTLSRIEAPSCPNSGLVLELRKLVLWCARARCNSVTPNNFKNDYIYIF